MLKKDFTMEEIFRTFMNAEGNEYKKTAIGYREGEDKNTFDLIVEHEKYIRVEYKIINDDLIEYVIKENTNKVMIDIAKPIYARDKESGKVYLVDGLYFPLGKLSGKDITIENKEEDISEWRSIEDVELIQDEYE